jgi:hypothetical protein
LSLPKRQIPGNSNFNLQRTAHAANKLRFDD